MKLKTNNAEINVGFAYAPTFDGRLVAQMTDDGQTYAEICAMLEGKEHIEVHESESEIRVHVGYTKMKRISRDNGKITITLEKPEVK